MRPPKLWTHDLEQTDHRVYLFPLRFIQTLEPFVKILGRFDGPHDRIIAYELWAVKAKPGYRGLEAGEYRWDVDGHILLNCISRQILPVHGMDQLTIQQTFDLALQHHRAGRLAEAEGVYQQILAQQPDHVVATHHLGLIAFQTGRIDDAVNLIRRAIALEPNYAEAFSDLGSVLKHNGQLDEAIAAFRRAVALKPNYAEGHNNLANALTDGGQFDEAIAACRRAITIRP